MKEPSSVFASVPFNATIENVPDIRRAVRSYLVIVSVPLPTFTADASVLHPRSSDVSWYVASAPGLLCEAS
ncbi:MAG: hypothetical protein NVS3B10_11530 [Polyangiales bacterium]